MHATALLEETLTDTHIITYTKWIKSVGKHKSCKHDKQHLPQTISLPSGHGIGSVLTRDISHMPNRNSRTKTNNKW